jgi:hypothetical protein
MWGHRRMSEACNARGAMSCESSLAYVATTSNCRGVYCSLTRAAYRSLTRAVYCSVTCTPVRVRVTTGQCRQQAASTHSSEGADLWLCHWSLCRRRHCHGCCLRAAPAGAAQGCERLRPTRPAHCPHGRLRCWQDHPDGCAGWQEDPGHHHWWVYLGLCGPFNAA